MDAIVAKTIIREYRPSHAERSDRSAGDRLRHRQKVRESIRENIADIISEESLIGKNREKVIKVPLRGIKEYRFIYGDNQPGVATGDGNAQPGQVVGQTSKEGKDKCGKAGDRPGIDYYETDVTLGELIDIMFEDMKLPDLERKPMRLIEDDSVSKRKGYRRKGIRARLDKRRTARERVKRISALKRTSEGDGAGLEAAEDDPSGLDVSVEKTAHGMKTTLKKRHPFHEDDLRYKHIEIKPRENSNAVVFMVMDVSGSMDTVKKYLARAFLFLAYQFIKSKYESIEVVFIAFHTEAKEVTEDEFFHKGESGGTFISSGQQKVLDLIAARYHPSLWNIYVLVVSDGDNFDSDNPAAVRTAKELLEVSNRVGYIEVKPGGSRYYESSMLNIFRPLVEKKFRTFVLEKKEGVYPAFKYIFGVSESEIA